MNLDNLTPKEIQKNAEKTVIVGMSGGVDSSVSALKLVEAGFNVIGVYMKNWSKDLPGMKCPWAEDLADAKRVAVKLGIPFEVWDFENEYYDRVVKYMIAEFKHGRTPNPDIMCNEEIKFKLFYEKAIASGADYIATGHYARIKNDDLLRAKDENKDQTYFLYRISDEATRRTIFPVGDMLKPEVKKLASEKGLHNAYKKESMGVCFVGEVGMKDFLEEYIKPTPGEIRELETENVLGLHDGAVFYTIGQRHGLYLSGEVGKVSDGLPYYVVKKDLEKNIVYVSKNLNSAELWTNYLTLSNMIYRGKTTPESLAHSDNLTVRLRHRAELVPVKVEIINQSTVTSSDLRNIASTPTVRLHFTDKIKRPASGQSAVIYENEITLAGGIIEEN